MRARCPKAQSFSTNNSCLEESFPPEVKNIIADHSELKAAKSSPFPRARIFSCFVTGPGCTSG